MNQLDEDDEDDDVEEDEHTGERSDGNSKDDTEMSGSEMEDRMAESEEEEDEASGKESEEAEYAVSSMQEKIEEASDWESAVSSPSGSRLHLFPQPSSEELRRKSSVVDEKGRKEAEKSDAEVCAAEGSSTTTPGRGGKGKATGRAPSAEVAESSGLDAKQEVRRLKAKLEEKDETILRILKEKKEEAEKMGNEREREKSREESTERSREREREREKNRIRELVEAVKREE
ncbi:uncharacterized protein MONOS_7308 [Monocercomonoides exilis]|uniref:uncharacterized protein n=1 Tax=Monocercomonoides exilis TaxID=2049356 RepID=UPI0035597004|nr:hypothetical protein MONOS_7308 [Monocercomonoides exilis]|eukprot:MONOS_7308.1-p1 / transcript=MONOS_7308.1 / gene=MONOS_7308 / organism=Monocercomonoides_exilis_PA203 / gene_product=unspecified product / transcript_product=unspecified product / location=Mono_scaffold00247:36267-37044(-) / protein_length=231 / sequence_SO=supercontig / SO=protein_coding / is_pseudo=false